VRARARAREKEWESVRTPRRAASTTTTAEAKRTKGPPFHANDGKTEKWRAARTKTTKNTHHRVLDALAQECLGRVAHLLQDHRRHLLGREHLVLALDLHAHVRFPAPVHDVVRNQLLVLLHLLVLVLAADEALDVVDGAAGVGGGLFF